MVLQTIRTFLSIDPTRYCGGWTEPLSKLTPSELMVSAPVSGSRLPCWAMMSCTLFFSSFLPLSITCSHAFGISSTKLTITSKKIATRRAIPADNPKIAATRKIRSSL